MNKKMDEIKVYGGIGGKQHLYTCYPVIDCEDSYVNEETQSKMPTETKTYIQMNWFELAWREFKKMFKGDTL
jgi:hypothetical protein